MLARVLNTPVFVEDSSNVFFVLKVLDSKACKTPLNFLAIKLLCHIQILWTHWNSWEEKYLMDKSRVVRLFILSG